MKRDFYISVAMATYNGEKYIKEQLDSIIKQLGKNDEVIISDDGSTDSTIDIINSYIKKDRRIKLFLGPKNGVKQNYANAISHCSGKYIFLSDQDDVWNEKKVNIVLKTFTSSKCTCVVHNANIVDEKLNKTGKTFFEYRKSGKGKIKNIVKNTYIGCCMAFDKCLVNKVLPIPNDIEMHDQWIGLLSEKYGKSIFINDCLVEYRRHDNNVSSMKHYPFRKMVKNRITIIKRYICEKGNE